MSRLASIRRIDTSDPQKLAKEIERLIAVLDQELDALTLARIQEWAEVTVLQRGSVVAKFGQLVRLDTTGITAPHVMLPAATSADIGKSIGVTRNQLSPTNLPVIHAAQTINYSGVVATLVASTIGIKKYSWTGQTWEGGRY